MRERRLHPALIALVGCLAAAPARADQLPRVGVAVSVEVNVDAAEAQKMSEALGRALHASLLVNVIAGTEAARRLPQEGVADNCVVDTACIADIAQRLGADQLLFLVVVRVGNRMQIDVTWADPASGRTVSRPAVTIEGSEDAEKKFAAASSLLMPDARPRPAVAQPPPVDGVAPQGGEEPRFVTRRRPRRMTTGAWIAAGVGGAALAGAVTFTLVTRSGYKDCDASGDCTDGKLDSIEKKALAADLLWGTTALAGAAAFVLVWMSGGQMEQVPVQVGPGPGVGLSIGGAL